MAKLFANSGDPDQMPHSVAFDLGLHCLQITFYGSPDYKGLKFLVYLLNLWMELVHTGLKFYAIPS